MGQRRPAARLRLRDPPDARQAPAGRRADPARAGLPGMVRPRDPDATPTTSHLERETDLERMLYACDEISGFVHACGLVRPDGLATLAPPSVKQEAEAEVVRRRRQPRRRAPGRRGARRRPRRAHRARDRGAAADLGRARARHRLTPRATMTIHPVPVPRGVAPRRGGAAAAPRGRRARRRRGPRDRAHGPMCVEWHVPLGVRWTRAGSRPTTRRRASSSSRCARRAACSVASRDARGAWAQPRTGPLPLRPRPRREVDAPSSARRRDAARSPSTRRSRSPSSFQAPTEARTQGRPGTLRTSTPRSSSALATSSGSPSTSNATSGEGRSTAIGSTPGHVGQARAAARRPASSARSAPASTPNSCRSADRRHAARPARRA